MGSVKTEYHFPRVRFSMGGTRARLVSDSYCGVRVLHQGF